MSSSRHSSFEKNYYKLSSSFKSNIDDDGGGSQLSPHSKFFPSKSPSVSTTSSFQYPVPLGRYLFKSYGQNLSPNRSVRSEKPRSIKFIDEFESASIQYSLRKLGFESASNESLANLRNHSYLRSIENDCVETLLIQLQPPESEKQSETKKEPIDGDKKDEAVTVTTPLIDGEEAKEEPKKSLFKRCCPFSIFTKDFWLKVPEKPWFIALFGAIGSQSLFYLIWLAIVSLFYIYNIIGIPMRYSFDYDKEMRIAVESTLPQNDSIESNLTVLEFENLADNWDESFNLSNSSNTTKYLIIDRMLFWSIVDYLSDFVFLIDIIIVQTRIKFLREGLWVSNLKDTAKNYIRSWKFRLDVVSLLPFDLIQLITGRSSLLRLNRLFKLHILWEFFDRWDRSVRNYVFVVRLIKLLTYFQIIIHLYACAYYKLSDWEMNTMHVKNDWVYGIKHTRIQNYVYSFLFGLKTASTIGNNPIPTTKEEFLFTAISYIIAMFLFSLIVGQIRNIIGSLSTKQDNYLIVLDSTIRFVNNLSLSDKLVKKVIYWFDYYAKEQDAIPFEAISFLPVNLQSDLAINIYLDLLSKVKLFQGCEKNLLYSLVLKLKPITFMPGDYVCQKGEVGREMYIIDKGIVEVIVNDKAVAQMKEGSVFGEIALLSMGAGGNRRTATIVSKGFSRLLILLKSDLNEVLKSYPGMEAQLRNAANSYLKKK